MLIELLVLYAIIAVIILAILTTCIVITPGKRANIIERLGKPLGKGRMPGLTFKLPWPIDLVVGQVSLQLLEIDADVSVKTADNAFLSLPVKAQYRASADPAGAVRAYYELEDPRQQITSYILNNVRQSASSMTMIELYQNRDSIEMAVQAALQEQFIKYGYSIENVLIDEPLPSVEVRDAFNRVIASEREREAARNLADAKRIELVGIAEAERESKKLQGQGLAEMREAIATGMEIAMKTLQQAGLSNSEALALLMDTNRLDTLGTAATHGNMILVDMQGADNLSSTVTALKALQQNLEQVASPKRPATRNPFAKPNDAM